MLAGCAAVRAIDSWESAAAILAAAFVLTDEAFAMAIGWFRRGRPFPGERRPWGWRDHLERRGPG